MKKDNVYEFTENCKDADFLQTDLQIHYNHHQFQEAFVKQQDTNSKIYMEDPKPRNNKDVLEE